MLKINIIGASFLGLCVGNLLLNDGFDVLILEKKSYTGGRLLLDFSDSENFLYTDMIYQFNLLNEKICNKYIELGLFTRLDFKKVRRIKRIYFKKNEGYIDIETSKKKLITLLSDISNKNDIVMIDKILADLEYLKEYENLNKKNVGILKKFKLLKYKYIVQCKIVKKKADNIIQHIDDNRLREVLKSICNKKSSYEFLLHYFDRLCEDGDFVFTNNIGNVIKKLEHRFKLKGGKILFNTNIKEVNSAFITDESKKKYYSDFTIISTDNLNVIDKIVRHDYINQYFDILVNECEHYDSYIFLVINLSRKNNFDEFIGVNRIVLDKPFIDSAQSFQRKFEFICKRSKLGYEFCVYFRGNFPYWSNLYKMGLDEFNIGKETFKNMILKEIEKKIYGLNDSIINIDIITPYEIFQKNDVYRGALRGFIPTPTFYKKEINVIYPDKKIYMPNIIFNQKSYFENVCSNMEYLIEIIKKNKEN